MYQITDEQIDFILDDLTARGIHLEGLRQSLLDHICIIIEQELDGDGDFEAFYGTVIRRFYRAELRELEDAAIFLAETRHRVILLSRKQFFAWLFTLVLGPALAYDIVGLLFTAKPPGVILPVGIWGPTVVFPLFPLLILLVLYFTPDRFDPLIPKGAKILLGWKPFITVVSPGVVTL